MNQSTKRRIVGTVVLLALVLIFLPIVFDGQGSYQTQLSSRVPAEPIISILPEPTQVRPVIIAESLPEEAEEEFSLSETGEDQDEVQSAISEPVFTQDIPRLSAVGLPEGWSVRLGSFAQEENANNLMQRLQGAGYKAYIRNIDNPQGRLTSVFVGPWLSRDLVERYKQELQEEFRLAGDIVRFEIEQL